MLSRLNSRQGGHQQEGDLRVRGHLQRGDLRGHLQQGDLPVDDNALLWRKAKIHEEMYVFVYNFVTNDNDFVILGFEVDAINLLQSLSY